MLSSLIAALAPNIFRRYAIFFSRLTCSDSDNSTLSKHCHSKIIGIFQYLRSEVYLHIFPLVIVIQFIAQYVPVNWLESQDAIAKLIFNVHTTNNNKSSLLIYMMFVNINRVTLFILISLSRSLYQHIHLIHFLICKLLDVVLRSGNVCMAKRLLNQWNGYVVLHQNIGVGVSGRVRGHFLFEPHDL